MKKTNRTTLIISETTAIILAGGRGTRLQAVVADRPKPLALVAGRPFIEYLFDQLGNAGIKQVIISTGYLADQIHCQYGSTYGTLSLRYSQEFNSLGTAGALRHALPLVSSKQVLVLNGDSYCDINFIELFETHKAKDALFTVTTVAVPDVSRYGLVLATREGCITDFKEKGSQVGAGFINAGIYLIEKSVLGKIAPDTMISLEKDIFPLYLGQFMYAYATIGTFIDIGIPDDYERAQQIFQRITKEQQGDA